MQAYFEIEDWRPTRATELFPELDVEDAVRRTTTDRSEYPLPVGGIYIVQVVPVRGDQVGHSVGGQAGVGERGVATCKLQVAVRGNVHRIEGLVVEGNRERQGDVRDTVVKMVTGVCRSGHDCAAGLGDGVVLRGGTGRSRCGRCHSCSCG